MSLAGLALACLFAGFQVVSNHGLRSTPNMFRRDLVDGTFVVAILWSAVVGSGVFAGEFEPRLEHFWRSRPISPSGWFWVKFMVGLLTVLAVLDLVTILVSWDTGDRYGLGGRSRSYGRLRARDARVHLCNRRADKLLAPAPRHRGHGGGTFASSAFLFFLSLCPARPGSSRFKCSARWNTTRKARGRST